MRIIRTSRDDAMDHAVYLEELPQAREQCLFCSGNEYDCTGECFELPQADTSIEEVDFNDK